MAESLTISFDHQALDSALDEMQAAALALVRPAAQAGTQVLYDEVVLRVNSMGKKTGALAGAIYQAFSKDNSSAARATYHVSWNARKAPHGHLVEYGHIQTRKVYLSRDGKWYTSKIPLDTPRRVAASPFLRPAYDARSAAALEAASAHYAEGMRELIARLS